MTRILDNVIDIAWYPFPEIEEAAKKYRRIGVSITGFGDYLIHNKIRYGSVKAIIKAKEVTQLINLCFIRRVKASSKREGAFPMFEQSTLDERLEGDPVFKLPRRILLQPPLLLQGLLLSYAMRSAVV
jgi:ribonucleotide reductase alpha subunit